MNNDTICFSYNNLYSVNIFPKAYEKIHEYCKKSNLSEIGGILIGNYSDDQKTANVIYVTSPPHDSHRTRCSFSRGTIGLKNILDSLWHKGFYYLGEWHYHPKSSPLPSRIDINQMKEFAKNRGLNCPEPILVIVGEVSRKEEFFVGVFTKEDYVQLQRI